MDDYDEFFNDNDDEDKNMFELEKSGYDRINKVEAVDMKNPKDKFLYLLNQNFDNFGISQNGLEKIKEVVSNFRELELESYNVDGILAGYAMYKHKPKNKSSFDEKYNEIIKHVNASKCDIVRYMRLWQLHLK